MRLHDTARPSSGSVCTVELQDPSEPAVLARSREHGAVLLDRSLAECLPDGQDLSYIVRQIFGEQPVEVILPELIGLYALIGEPSFKLLQAVRVLQAGDPDRFPLQLRAVLFVKANDFLYHRKIYPDAVIVHALVELPELLLAIRERLQFRADRHLGDDVLPVIFDV